MFRFVYWLELFRLLSRMRCLLENDHFLSFLCLSLDVIVNRIGGRTREVIIVESIVAWLSFL